MWLTCSSIGRKVVMALTGLCLVLFVTFHAVMNGVALFWPAGYNDVCAFLGANWYALVASAGLAALFIIHIIYACWLTLQNRKARGHNDYEVTKRAPGVEWSSKNMLILGVVILAFLVVHMIQFWAKMQLNEIVMYNHTYEGDIVPPQAGTLLLQEMFSQVYTPIIYIIGFVALWFHMNHGMWSMMQSTGLNNNIWLPRLKSIGCWWSTIVCGLFLAECIVFTVNANRETYTNTPALEEQYQQYRQEWNEKINGGGVFEEGQAPVTDTACCGQDCTEQDSQCTGDCATCPNAAAGTCNDPACQQPQAEGAEVEIVTANE